MTAPVAGSAIRVLIVDDHPVVRSGLAHLLAAQPDLEVVGEAATAQSGAELFRQHRPDVTLIDMSLPDARATETIAALLTDHPAARFIVLSVYTGSEDVYRALKAGALGYVAKDSEGEEIVRAIRSVHSGQRYLSATAASSLADRLVADQLTATEFRVLELMAQGKSNKQIGARMNVAEGTVKTHVASILRKLQAESRSGAISLAFRRGMIHPQ